MSEENPGRRPNVVIVITDDQGYGDLACHGNPVIKTPNLDELRGVSFRLTNFHVGPTCAPTRAGVMTGRYCNCTGVWHTIAGRSLLRKDEITLADVFKKGGYRTGMFGKWHLGDNYPFRPHHRGFDEAVYHGGGGVSQTPDFWGNDYFNDTYFDKGVPKKYEGYCTDVWFDLAMGFIERNRERPFFCYLSTNAPHGPYNVADDYAKPYYATEPIWRARFYGMITCIDDNMARLRAKLRELDLERDTILIFVTDNGSSGGCNLDRSGFLTDGYNAGMRGKKGSEYDGGHRTPLFLHWPAGGMDHGRDVNELTANIDILPTLADLCGIELSEPPADDTSFAAGRVNGRSIVPLLDAAKGAQVDWPERVIVTDSQRIARPEKWRKSATMTKNWRLVNGTELYDIEKDPGQRDDVAKDHPDVVERLRAEYEKWWELVSTRFDEPIPIIIGSDEEPVSCLTAHDWQNEGSACPWNQGQIRSGQVMNGFWDIDVARAGEYEFELRRWPVEGDRAMRAGIPGRVADWYTGGRAINLKHARIKVGERDETRDIPPDAKGVKFTFELPAGETTLETELTDSAGERLGAYYVYARRVG